MTPTPEQVEKMREALQEIAKQPLYSEMTIDAYDADVDGAYEMMIETARAALKKAGIE